MPRCKNIIVLSIWKAEKILPVFWACLAGVEIASRTVLTYGVRKDSQ
jgi:hypothetical protein